jgi:8-oxo-dGTP diphosphatase
VPREHDAVRWLRADQLDEVRWLGPDVAFLAAIRARLGTP